MSDFLGRLAERQLAATPGVLPRVPPRFAPSAPTALSANLAPPLAAPPVQPPASGTDASHTIVKELRVEQAPASPLVPARPARPRESEQPASVESNVVPKHRAAADRRQEATAPPPVRRTEIIERFVPARPRVEAAASSEPAARVVVDRRPEPAETHRRADARVPVMPSPLVPPKADSPAMPPSAPAEARPADRDDSPVVKVTIGRVEVRAVAPPAPVRERRAAPARPRMSLEEYLERRHGGRR
jgi:hypothetical protein